MKTYKTFNSLNSAELHYGDELHFKVSPGLVLVYIVLTTHLEFKDHINLKRGAFSQFLRRKDVSKFRLNARSNGFIFDIVLEKMNVGKYLKSKFVEACFGYPEVRSEFYSFPECHTQDYEALKRIALAIFAKLEGASGIQFLVDSVSSKSYKQSKWRDVDFNDYVYNSRLRRYILSFESEIQVAREEEFEEVEKGFKDLMLRAAMHINRGKNLVTFTLNPKGIQHVM